MAECTDLNPSDLFDQKQAAAIIDKTPGTLAVWRHLGRGPAFLKIGRSVRYHRRDLLKYLDGCRRVSTSEV